MGPCSRPKFRANNSPDSPRQSGSLAIAFAICNAVLGVWAYDTERTGGPTLDSQSLGGMLFVLGMALAWMVTAGLLARVIFVWVKLAWVTAVALRGLAPRINETTAAWLCVIPFINLGGLMYILEWLLIRSRSATEVTFGWKSYKSVEPLATTFVYVLGLHLGTQVWTELPWFEALGPSVIVSLEVLGFLSLVGSLYLGHRIAIKTNQNLAESRKPNIL